MRYFKLENSAGKVLDITTKQLFFHDIGGLGFEEENDFTAVGRIWKLNSSSYRQGIITGTMCFNQTEDKTPYTLYREFSSFISKTPLQLLYFPEGINGSEFRKRVRVSRLEKSEINTYGVIDSSIEFISYTPWYKIVKDIIVPQDASPNDGWIWDRENKWRDSITEDYSLYHYSFNSEQRRTVRFLSDSDSEGTVKLSIHGPLLNPTWTQYVNGIRVATGGLVDDSPITIGQNEVLIVDNTGGSYSITVYNNETEVERNVYGYRDFNKTCFFNIKQGLNEIVIITDNDDAIRIEAEGHIYYATI